MLFVVIRELDTIVFRFENTKFKESKAFLLLSKCAKGRNVID